MPPKSGQPSRRGQPAAIVAPARFLGDTRQQDVEHALAILEDNLRHRPTVARVMLQMPTFTRDVAVLRALFLQQADPVAESIRARRVRLVAAELLAGIRERAEIPEESFMASSQAPAVGVTQPVVYFDPTQPLESQMEEAAATQQRQQGDGEAAKKTADAGNDAVQTASDGGAAGSTEDSNCDGGHLDAMQLYMLLEPCRSGDDPGDPVHQVLRTLEADSRATINLGELIRKLRRLPTTDAQVDAPPIDDAAAEAAVEEVRLQLGPRVPERVAPQLVKATEEALAGIEAARKRLRDAQEAPPPLQQQQPQQQQQPSVDDAKAAEGDTLDEQPAPPQPSAPEEKPSAPAASENATATAASEATPTPQADAPGIPTPRPAAANTAAADGLPAAQPGSALLPPGARPGVAPVVFDSFDDVLGAATSDGVRPAQQPVATTSSATANAAPDASPARGAAAVPAPAAAAASPAGRPSTGRQRREFTAEEDEAILRGLKRHAGHGCWEKVLRLYPEVWVPGRTAQALHDRYRRVLRLKTLAQNLQNAAQAQQHA